MDFSSFMESIVSYAQGHTVLVIALALCFLFLLYRRPKLFFGMLFLCLFLAGLYYMIMSIAGTGSERKKGILFEEGKQTDSNR